MLYLSLYILMTVLVWLKWKMNMKQKNASEEKFTQNKTWRMLFFQHYDHTIRMFLKRHNGNVNMT